MQPLDAAFYEPLKNNYQNRRGGERARIEDRNKCAHGDNQQFQLI